MTAPLMQPPLTTESGPAGALVRVACRLDADGSEPLAQEIDRLLRAGAHVVRLDLAAVAFISSAGLGALAAAHRKLKAAGGRLEVAAASPQVAAVLKLTKLDTLIGPGLASAAPPAAPMPADDRTVGEVRLVALTAPGSRAAAPRVVAANASPQSLVLSAATCAVGLGTPDVDDPAPRDHAGEVVVAGGCVFHRPPAPDPRIDWVVAQAGHAARVALVEGVCWEFAAAGSAGFEPTMPDATVSLDALARAVVQVAGGAAVGFVAVGEIHGLVGAELIRPLGEATAVDHPRAGTAAVASRWLSFSREPVHAGRTALVVGIVSPVSPADAVLAPLLRPLDPGDVAGPVGHVHAAVFPYRPVRREPGDPRELVTALAATPPLAVMHLLADPAPLVGSGKPEFRRGVVWFGPLGCGGGPA